MADRVPYYYDRGHSSEEEDAQTEELLRQIAQGQIDDAVNTMANPKPMGDPDSFFGDGGAMDRGGIPAVLGRFLEGGKLAAGIAMPMLDGGDASRKLMSSVQDWGANSPNLAYALGGKEREAAVNARLAENNSAQTSKAEFHKKAVEEMLALLDEGGTDFSEPSNIPLDQAIQNFRAGEGGTYSRTHFRTPLTKKMEDEARQLEMASALGANESRDKLLPDLIKGLTESSKTAMDTKSQKEMMANFLGAADNFLPPEVSGLPRADENPSLTDKDRTKVGKATTLSPSDLMAARIAELKRRAKSKKLTKEDIEEIFGAKLSENKTKR